MKIFSGTVYHGSGTRFQNFDAKKARIMNDFYGGGIAYFTDNKDIGIQYAKSMSKQTKTPYIYEVKLTFRNLFDVNSIFTGKNLIDILPKDIDKFARGAGILSWKSDQYVVLGNLKMGKYELSGDEVFRGLSSGMNQTAVAREHLISKGFDGLRYNGGINMQMNTKHSVFLAYYPRSIKIEKIETLLANNALEEIKG